MFKSFLLILIPSICFSIGLDSLLLPVCDQPTQIIAQMHNSKYVYTVSDTTVKFREVITLLKNNEESLPYIQARNGIFALSICLICAGGVMQCIDIGAGNTGIVSPLRISGYAVTFTGLCVSFAAGRQVKLGVNAYNRSICK